MNHQITTDSSEQLHTPAVTYSTIAERAAASQQLIVGSILPDLSGVKPNRSKSGWSFFCPLEHRKKNAPAAIWVNDEGWIVVHCFDCRRNDELRERLVTPHLHGRSSPAPRPTVTATSNPRPQSQPSYPAMIWADTTAIPNDPAHSARRWFANRNLWRHEVETPAPLRWLPASRSRPGPHTGAGSLVALLAHPDAWVEAWPHLPVPQAVEIIAVDGEGKPALDRPEIDGGLGKRTLGAKVGSVLVLGNPRLTEIDAPVRVAEGVADALALASRFSGPAIASMGDAGMTAGKFPKWLAQARAGVVIHADNDDAGQAAAGRLLGAVRVHGGRARAVLPPQGKDAGVVAADNPFAPLTERWPGYADTLSKTNSWPRWEGQRQAALLMEEVSE